MITEAASDSRIRKGGFSTSLPAYVGGLIFPGDVLVAKHGLLRLSFCPEAASYSLQGGELKVNQVNVTLAGTAGVLLNVGSTPCRLPGLSPASYRDVRTGADRLQQVTLLPAPPNEIKLPLTTHQQDELDKLNSLLARNPNDITALLTHAIALEEANDLTGASLDYRKLIALAPNANWMKDELRSVLARRDRLAAGDGKVIGVVIGISEYMNLKITENLQFADRDAESFYDFLMSPRGGARSADVALLLNSQAKLADMNLAIDEAFARARPQDEVVLFVAAHGVPVPDGGNAGPYIMAYDSNPQEPSSMYGMTKLQDVTNERLRPQKVQIIADTCHAGLIGSTDAMRQNLFEANFFDQRRAHTKVLGLLASRGNESSYECSELDHGHGVFTFYLMAGLNSLAAVDKSLQQITVYSLSQYVNRSVTDFTKAINKRQTPISLNPNMNDDEVVARVELAGAPAAAVPNPANVRPGVCSGDRGVPAPHRAPPTQGLLDPQKLAIAGQLNAGQEVILRYLKGEQEAMTSADFQRGENFFAAASQLEGGTNSFTEARLLFCKGRRLVYEGHYQEAVDTLEDAIRLDPLGAYTYNALGIAFLQTPDFERAIAAFQDAIRLAPAWAYARHNLALALSQAGRYDQAIAAYRAAIRAGPEYLYIRFNLGLLYQRLNRGEEARAIWQQVLNDSPRLAKAKNAIGLSYALDRRAQKAESAYLEGLATANDQVDRLAIRHNLALLLKGENRLPEALGLWWLNYNEDPDDLPTLTALSEALSERGDSPAAETVFLKLLGLKPGYDGARLKYAALLQRAGKNEEAISQLRELRKHSPNNAGADDMLGDLLNSEGGGNRPEILSLYQTALANTSSREQRRRLEKKIASFGPR